MLQADQGEARGDRGLLDRALQTALKNFQQAEALGLVYSRAEGHRTLAHVRFRRGELDEAWSLCVAALEIVSATESRVSLLWLGPLYVEILLALESAPKLLSICQFIENWSPSANLHASAAKLNG